VREVEREIRVSEIEREMRVAAVVVGTVHHPVAVGRMKKGQRKTGASGLHIGETKRQKQRKAKQSNKRGLQDQNAIFRIKLTKLQ